MVPVVVVMVVTLATLMVGAVANAARATPLFEAENPIPNALKKPFIHVLDYKPEAERVDATSQLTIYALALASRTNLAVRDIKCAWFDDRNYFEFFPLHAVYRICNEASPGRLYSNP